MTFNYEPNPNISLLKGKKKGFWTEIGNSGYSALCAGMVHQTKACLKVPTSADIHFLESVYLRIMQFLRFVEYQNWC